MLCGSADGGRPVLYDRLMEDFDTAIVSFEDFNQLTQGMLQVRTLALGHPPFRGPVISEPVQLRGIIEPRGIRDHEKVPW